ncbi:MAG: hypothetical protein J7L92_02025, partial [Dehalococcoidia bacterium]|nr:hypothetical protein [Dehalococcoidia bacterium]
MFRYYPIVAGGSKCTLRRGDELFARLFEHAVGEIYVQDSERLLGECGCFGGKRFDYRKPHNIGLPVREILLVVAACQKDIIATAIRQMAIILEIDPEKIIDSLYHAYGWQTEPMA